jgi:hypothetical protein
MPVWDPPDCARRESSFGLVERALLSFLLFVLGRLLRTPEPIARSVAWVIDPLSRELEACLSTSMNTVENRHFK